MIDHKSSGTWKVAIILVMAIAAIGFSGLVTAEEDKGKYVGVEKCKNCHEAEYKGNQYAKWKEMAHSKAWETLASEEAKKINPNAQSDDKCIKCHVTAFGVPDSKKDDKFDRTMGVQCESCHGPGEKHVKARLKAAAEADTGGDLFGMEEGEPEKQEVPEGEIVKEPGKDVCISCHNDESPTFKEFNFEEAKKQIAHPDPRSK